MSEESDLEEVLLLVLLRRRQKRRQRQSRRMWVRSIFAQQGEYHHLLQEMRLSDPESHFSYLRKSKETFDLLLTKVEPLLATSRHYSSDSVRVEITPAERLAITLRFLATGNSQLPKDEVVVLYLYTFEVPNNSQTITTFEKTPTSLYKGLNAYVFHDQASLSFGFRVGRSTICTMLQRTCKAIWEAIHSEYVKAPSTEEEWRGVSEQFNKLWNFPNCIGAIDGKHIVIQAPTNSGSTYFNYKGTHSVVLLAVCVANYRFILVDVGDAGRHSDGGVLSNSLLGEALEDNALHIPKGCPLPGTTSPSLPYVIVGDEAFPMKQYLMRPYPGRNLSELTSIFNYRLSRARRVIENSFGILAARWRIFRRPIIADPKNVVLYTMAAVALHNFLRTTESSVYCPPGFIDGEDGTGNWIPGGWRADDSEGLTSAGEIGTQDLLVTYGKPFVLILVRQLVK